MEYPSVARYKIYEQIQKNHMKKIYPSIIPLNSWTFPCDTILKSLIYRLYRVRSFWVDNQKNSSSRINPSYLGNIHYLRSHYYILQSIFIRCWIFRFTDFDWSGSFVFHLRSDLRGEANVCPAINKWNMIRIIRIHLLLTWHKWTWIVILSWIHTIFM